jgi:hypothetical protein
LLVEIIANKPEKQPALCLSGLFRVLSSFPEAAIQKTFRPPSIVCIDFKVN